MQTERTKELGKGADVEALVPSVCEYIRFSYLCPFVNLFEEKKLSICENFIEAKSCLTTSICLKETGRNRNKFQYLVRHCIVMCESEIIVLQHLLWIVRLA